MAQVTYGWTKELNFILFIHLNSLQENACQTKIKEQKENELNWEAFTSCARECQLATRHPQGGPTFPGARIRSIPNTEITPTVP